MRQDIIMHVPPTKTIIAPLMMQSMPPESSVSPRRQALFAQRKLKEIYDKTCVRLDPYRDVVEIVQEVILWRKPTFTGLLYVFVHFVFW